MVKRIVCEDVMFTFAGMVAVSPQGKIFAYVCPACDHTHIAIDGDSQTLTVVSLHEDQANELARQLINPPTLETVND